MKYILVKETVLILFGARNRATFIAKITNLRTEHIVHKDCRYIFSYIYICTLVKCLEGFSLPS